uniref:Palmitoyltransferase n=1 Tax=Ditylum brightwellii TaxID=49249 RepID=A0A7S4VY78_9STRA
MADPEISSIASLCQKSIPNFFMNQMRNVFGAEIINALVNGIHFLQIVYLFVVLGSWSVMFAHGYPMMDTSSQVSSYHKYSGYVVFMLCMTSWRRACKAPPGYITENSIMKFDNYPYDNLLYTNKLCPTVHIRKLARSKYDRVSNRHVPRFDHYCGWLNQSVGEENYRYFLFFLLVHTVMVIYGSIVTALLFYGEIIDKDLHNARFFNVATGAEVIADNMMVFHYLLMTHFYLAMVLLLMSIMTLMLGAFLGFHLYITARGMTTNEYFKWKEVRKWYKKATRQYQKAVQDGKVGVSVSNNSSSSSVDKGGISDDTDIGCTGPMNTTTSNGSGGTATTTTSTTTTNKTKNDIEEEIMDPGPFPQNIYDHGIIENFKEVIYPRSTRPNALKRWVDWHKTEERLRQHTKTEEQKRREDVDVVNGKTKAI